MRLRFVSGAGGLFRKGSISRIRWSLRAGRGGLKVEVEVTDTFGVELLVNSAVFWGRLRWVCLLDEEGRLVMVRGFEDPTGVPCKGLGKGVVWELPFAFPATIRLPGRAG